MKYGAFESFPCIYDDREGRVLFDRASGDWRKIPLAEIMMTARPMTEDQFKRTYGKLPPRK
jgi:hypothetical protein